MLIYCVNLQCFYLYTILWEQMLCEVTSSHLFRLAALQPEIISLWLGKIFCFGEQVRMVYAYWNTIITGFKITKLSGEHFYYC